MLAVSRAVYHKFYVDPDVFGLGAGLQETAYFEVFFGIAAHMRVGFVAGKSLSRPAFRRALRFFCRAWYVFFFRAGVQWCCLFTAKLGYVSLRGRLC